MATEQCFQPRLQELATQWSTKVTPLCGPDPQDCISYETEALSVLLSCYNESVEQVCSLLTDELNEDFVTDLKKIVSALSISDYYKPIITSDIRNMIKSCSAGSASATADMAVPSPNERILLCAAADTDFDNFLSVIPNILHRDSSEFVYADIGPVSGRRDSLCQFKSPPDGSGSLMTGYRLIQWTPLTSDDQSKTLTYKKQRISADTQIFFYKLSKHSSSCGNGLREAGELCDTFGELYLGNEDYGCNSQCAPVTNFECSFDQMSISSCAKPLCGDGKRSSLEECDDGNTLPGDGCSEECKIEPFSECSELLYNSTSVCHPVEQVSSSIPTIVPTITTSTQTPSHTTTSVATETTTTRPVIVIPTLSVLEPTVGLHSSAHSVLRTSSISWITLLLLLSIYLLLLR